MGIINYYQMTDKDLEEQADITKVVVLRALVRAGMLDEEAAEEWSSQHTLLKRKKGFFRTISDKWKNEDVDDSSYWIVVKNV